MGAASHSSHSPPLARVKNQQHKWAQKNLQTRASHVQPFIPVSRTTQPSKFKRTTPAYRRRNLSLLSSCSSFLSSILGPVPMRPVLRNRPRSQVTALTTLPAVEGPGPVHSRSSATEGMNENRSPRSSRPARWRIAREFLRRWSRGRTEEEGDLEKWALVQRKSDVSAPDTPVTQREKCGKGWGREAIV